MPHILALFLSVCVVVHYAIRPVIAQSSFMFDMVVFNACKSIIQGQGKQGIDKLIQAGFRPDEYYFDIQCPNNGLLLTTSLNTNNYKSAQYLLEYLRWRERETGVKNIRTEILNIADNNGLTIVDIAKQSETKSTDIAKISQLNAFIELFQKHGGKCSIKC